MSLRGAALLLSAVVVLLSGAGSASGRALESGPTPACNGGSCSGWFKTNVSVTWTAPAGSSLQNCQFDTIASDTTGTTLSCTAFYSDSLAVTSHVTVKRDATPPTVTGAAPARGPDGSGWYTSPVGVTFAGTDATSQIASCTTTTYSGPDSASASVSGTCTDNAGNSASGSFALRYDGSGPSIEASPARAPDSNGWYTRPVSFTVSGSDSASGLDSCNAPSYGGPDNASGSVTATCRDRAGNTSSRSIGVRYDATPPSVTGASPDRAPDSGEWYTRGLTITFAGADGTSGVGGCTQVAYSGPDAQQASVSGTCRDHAGNTSAPGSFAFRFDATPPKLTKAQVAKGDRFVKLTWAATGAASAEVARAEGNGEPTVIYRGGGSTFTDRGVRNGVRYRYVLAVADQAGNAVRTTLAALPRPALYRPARGERVRGPVTLAWEKAPKATYYNLQLHRQVRGRWVKVLTRWPAKPWFRVTRSWKGTTGARERLVPGRYRWYVWPGLGKRAANRYGKLLGSSEFVVRR